YELFQHESAFIFQAHNYIQQEFLNAQWQLKQNAYLNDSAEFIFQRLEALPLVMFDEKNDTALNLVAAQKKIDALQSEIKMQKVSARQPGLQAGYFAQSLEGDYSFQGVRAGIQIPIDRRASKVKWKQLEIKKQQQINELSMRQTQIAAKAKMLNNKLTLLKESIDNYQNKVLSKQQTIYEKTHLQFKQGEIDFFRFSQIQERVIKSHTEYLSLVKMYNNQVLNIMYLKQN
ncbi:MAG: TolC family protein, partial [Bacteroidia bacterium]|nr:TolC family protein [Bacteroidia bacterium]